MWMQKPSLYCIKPWLDHILNMPTLSGTPTRKKDIETIEKVQKRANKLVISVKKLTYKDRLIELNQHTLKYRRIRADDRGI